MAKIVLSLITIGFVFLTYAQAPVFFEPETIQASGANMQVDYYGAPYAYDWNGDGNKDLLVGQFVSGAVRLYENTGTNNNPQFGDFSYLQASGTNIALPSG